MEFPLGNRNSAVRKTFLEAYAAAMLGKRTLVSEASIVDVAQMSSNFLCLQPTGLQPASKVLVYQTTEFVHVFGISRMGSMLILRMGKDRPAFVAC